MKGKKPIITKHSKNRCKERLGLGKKYTNTIASKALTNGLKYYQLTGQLKKYVGFLYESHDRRTNNIILYNREVFVFQDNKLITIFHLPRQYYVKYDKLQKKINEIGEGK